MQKNYETLAYQNRMIRSSSKENLYQDECENTIFNLNDINNSKLCETYYNGSNIDVNNEQLTSSQIYQNNNHHRINHIIRRDSSDIKMIYDYYQKYLLKDKVYDQFSSTVDRYGFVELEDNKPRDTKYVKKDAKRSVKWACWLSRNKYVIHSEKFGSSLFEFPWNSKFINRISKGIPDPWRNPVWYFLVTKGCSITESDDDLILTYKSLLKLPSSHERQIDLDIPRTLHKHIMFRTRYGSGQIALFNILRAFANYDKQVGYCQGMANIGTILLMYYPEEYAFIMLTKLFIRCNLHNLYIPGFPALMESFYVQEKLMNMYTPKISNHFCLL
ncbi:4966_t:CDS:2 [Funneliformis geosporum]|uniref:4966_t:CDS:1 n=1 Tax=Funneliformis geosporum TaxID=1117311 RepID=A0A9W4WRD7_9GLOM|nr:4966_t:CDS:2 [Funneliformis geosporum]